MSIEILNQDFSETITPRNNTEQLYVVYGANPELTNGGGTAGIVFRKYPANKQIINTKNIFVHPGETRLCKVTDQNNIRIVHAVAPCINTNNPWFGSMKDKLITSQVLTEKISTSFWCCSETSYVPNRDKLARMMTELYFNIFNQIYEDYKGKKNGRIAIVLLGAGLYGVPPEISANALGHCAKFFKEKYNDFPQITVCHKGTNRQIPQLIQVPSKKLTQIPTEYTPLNQMQMDFNFEDYVEGTLSVRLLSKQ